MRSWDISPYLIRVFYPGPIRGPGLPSGYRTNLTGRLQRLRPAENVVGADAAEENAVAFDFECKAVVHGDAHLPDAGGALDPLHAQRGVIRVVEIERQLLVCCVTYRLGEPPEEAVEPGREDGFTRHRSASLAPRCS